MYFLWKNSLGLPLFSDIKKAVKRLFLHSFLYEVQALQFVFGQILFNFLDKLIAVVIFENFYHSTAYHGVYIQSGLYRAGIGLKSVASFSAREGKAKFYAGTPEITPYL